MCAPSVAICYSSVYTGHHYHNGPHVFRADDLSKLNNVKLGTLDHLFDVKRQLVGMVEAAEEITGYSNDVLLMEVARIGR